MSSNIESVPFDIKSEEDTISIEIKVEPMIFESEGDIETEEYDHIGVIQEKQETDIPPACTISKVDDAEACVEKLLNNSEKKLLTEEINGNENGNAVLPLVHDFSDTLEVCLKEDKFAIHEHAEDKADTQTVYDTSQTMYDSSVFEHYNNSISRQHNLVGHFMQPHMDEKCFQCDFCSKSFAEKKNLVLHMYIHTGEKNFKCSMCTKSFSRKFHLDRHMRSHSGEKPFQCEFCSKSFSEKMNLMVHMFNICTRTSNSNNCDSSASHHSEQMRRHSSEKTFKCDFCDKSFAEKKNLVPHMAIHTGKKNFSCDICSKAFFRKFHLERHRRTHSGEKRFQCELCSKLFSEKKSLLVHMHSHTVENCCNICNKSFLRKLDLFQHLSDHSPE